MEMTEPKATTASKSRRPTNTDILNKLASHSDDFLAKLEAHAEDLRTRYLALDDKTDKWIDQVREGRWTPVIVAVSIIGSFVVGLFVGKAL